MPLVLGFLVGFVVDALYRVEMAVAIRGLILVVAHCDRGLRIESPEFRRYSLGLSLKIKTIFKNSCSVHHRFFQKIPLIFKHVESYLE